MGIDTEELLEESKYLLEFDFDLLHRSPVEQQSYWVRAMKAMRKAGRPHATARARQDVGDRRRAAKKRTPWKVLGTTSIVRQIQQELTLQTPKKDKHPSTAAREALNPSIKCLRKSD